MLLAAGLLAGCSGSNEPEPAEITVRTGVAPMTQRLPTRRAMTYDNTTALQTENLRIDAYFLNTTTKYLNGAKLHYASSWKFWTASEPGEQVHYYWPIEGSVYDPASANITVSSLDFVGYSPYDTPLYIRDLTYTAAHNVTFDCTDLPMTSEEQDDLKEFMFGMRLGQNKTNASSGVNLSFQHPFARIKLMLAASHPDITINSITFKGLQNNGSYDLSRSPDKWTLSGDATNLVFGDTATCNSNPASARQIGEDFIVIPQEWEGEIEVNASWEDWGDELVPHNLSTTITPVTWEAGYSYTYTFHISPDDLTVNITNFTEQW